MLHGDQDRVVVPFAAIPPRVRQAVLAIEDARFYQHGALDLRGIGRALVSDLRGGTVFQGGSTITQQYVKTVVTGDQVSLHRKLVEAVDAAQLTRRATKDQILGAYLNEVRGADHTWHGAKIEAPYALAFASGHLASWRPARGMA